MNDHSRPGVLNQSVWGGCTDGRLRLVTGVVVCPHGAPREQWMVTYH